MSEAATPSTPPRGQTRATPRAAPNYAARRMLVTTVAIVAIAAFGVFGWTVIRGDDHGFSGAPGDWSELALVDRATGEITVVNGDGDVERTIVGKGRVETVHTFGDRIALVGPTQIVIEGGAESVTVPIDRSDTVTPVPTAEGLDLVVGTPTGGNVLVVDVTTGEVLDIGARAAAAAPQTFADPLLFAETLRWSDDAQVFAVADASSFQTIVVRKGATDAAFFRAQPVAVDDERIATSQIVGGQAEVELYDNDRDSTARVPVPIPAGGVMHDGDLIMVAIDGGVYQVGDGDQEAERLAQVAVPSGDAVDSVMPVLDGERLVVTGGTFEAVIDLDGTTIFTTTFTEPVSTSPIVPSWACVAIGGGDLFHSIVEVDEGQQLAELSDVVVTETAADGCTVLAERVDTVELIGPDGSAAVGDVRRASIGPDGATVVRTTSAGVTELLRVDDDLTLGDAVDLTELTPRNVLFGFLGAG